MLSVAEVLELMPGDEKDATWINPGFRAIVSKIVKAKGKKSPFRPMVICTLVGTNDVGELGMTVFQASVPFNEGDEIEVSGQGLRRTQYNGIEQASPGKGTTFHVITKGDRGHVEPPAGSRPVDNERHPDPAAGSAARPGDNSEFHRAMKKMALMYCHAKDYAGEINKRSPFTTPEQEQTCVSTLFIEGARRNLIDIAPARGAAPAAEAAKRTDAPASGRADSPKRTEKPQPGPDGSAFQPNADPGEDVPF